MWLGIKPRDISGKHVKEVVGASVYEAIREKVERALSSGFQMHMPKPVEPDELISIITDLVGVFGKSIKN